MLYGILSAILTSFSDITYKKALDLGNGKVSDKLFQFLAVLQGIVLMAVLGFLFLGESQIQELLSHVINIQIISLIALSAIIGIVAEFLFQYAFKNEKVSVLTPFGQLEGIFTVLLGFIFLSGNSVISLVFAIIAGVVLLFSSVDIKKLSINKYCISMILASFLSAITYLIYGTILLKIAPETLLIFETTLNLIFLGIIIILYKELPDLKQTTKKFHSMLFVNTATWYISVFIGMYLISEFGVVQAVLIGMLGLVTNLLFSYLFLGESIARKDIIVTVLVGLCIAGGTIFG